VGRTGKVTGRASYCKLAEREKGRNTLGIKGKGGADFSLNTNP